MAKRGRPRKPVDQGPLKYQLYRSEEAEEKNGILMRTGSNANDYSFHDKDKLAYSIMKRLVYDKKPFPLGVILKDCGYYDMVFVQNCLMEFHINPEYTAMRIGGCVAKEFENEMIGYSSGLANKPKVDIGFHLYMVINMRMFGNNLSVVNQIINDTHYNFFRNHPACYIFTTSILPNDPECCLHIYVSNYCIKNHSRLSTHLFYGLNGLGYSSRLMVNGIADRYTNNGTRPYHINPFSTNPKSITSLSNSEIELKESLSYKDWYNSNFKNDKDVIIPLNDIYKPMIRI